MSEKPFLDQRIEQLIDANLDRGREGLRVIEEWCRFGQNNKELIIKIKGWRHQLGLHHHDCYKNARFSIPDPGIGLSHPSQIERSAPLQVVSANCARVQEAMRVIEEFSRRSNPSLSKIASEIRYGVYEVELQIIRTSNKEKRINLIEKCSLCLITSPSKSLNTTVEKALKAGLKMVQYRTKSSDDLTNLSEANELSRLCKIYDSLFIVNDRIDIALAVDADGVHLGQKDIPVQIARKILGSEKLIGSSIHCLKELRLAEENGCDYVGAGPVNKTQTKPNLEAKGIKYLSETCNSTYLPWFAIGGINNTNLQELISAGTKRVAVCTAIMNAKDPSRNTIELLEAFQ